MAGTGGVGRQEVFEGGPAGSAPGRPGPGKGRRRAGMRRGCGLQAGCRVSGGEATGGTGCSRRRDGVQQAARRGAAGVVRVGPLRALCGAECGQGVVARGRPLRGRKIPGAEEFQERAAGERAGSGETGCRQALRGTGCCGGGVFPRGGVPGGGVPGGGAGNGGRQAVGFRKGGCGRVQILRKGFGRRAEC